MRRIAKCQLFIENCELFKTATAGKAPNLQAKPKERHTRYRQPNQIKTVLKHLRKARRKNLFLFVPNLQFSSFSNTAAGGCPCYSSEKPPRISTSQQVRTWMLREVSILPRSAKGRTVVEDVIGAGTVFICVEVVVAKSASGRVLLICKIRVCRHVCIFPVAATFRGQLRPACRKSGQNSNQETKSCIGYAAEPRRIHEAPPQTTHADDISQHSQSSPSCTKNSKSHISQA